MGLSMSYRMIRLFTVLALSAITIVTLFANIIAYGNDMRIVENMAIEIANKEAKKLGYNIESMTVRASHYKSPLNEYISDSKEEYYVERRGKLKNKEYWAIYYSDPKFNKGGDICIFVDSSNGEIITSIRGK